ncbi:MAG: hypothetical protein ACK553_11860 [Planctomycetota bacterium]|jgi:hypothetical protein
MPSDQQHEQTLESRALWKLAAYIFGVVVISVLLLAVNAGMVFGLATALEARFQTFPLIEPITQYAIYVVPVLFLYLEWYAWDVLISIRRHK